MSRAIGCAATFLLTLLTICSQATAQVYRDHGSASSPWTRDYGKPDLEDWRNPVTGSASSRAIGCGAVVAEAVLVAGGMENHLDLVIVNDSASAITLFGSEVHAAFGSGVRRRLRPATLGDERIRPGWLLHSILAFPAKSDFEGESTLNVTVELGRDGGERCRLRMDFERNPGIAPLASTHTQFSKVDMSFAGGARVATVGPLADLDDSPGFHMDFGFRGFFDMHHGLQLDIALDAYNRVSVSRAYPSIPYTRESELTAVGFHVGYVFRWQWARWFETSYALGSGLMAFEATAGQRYHVSVVTPIRQQLFLTFKRPLAPMLDLCFGPVLNVTTTPYGRLGHAKLNGTSLAPLLLIGMQAG